MYVGKVAGVKKARLQVITLYKIWQNSGKYTFAVISLICLRYFKIFLR